MNAAQILEAIAAEAAECKKCQLYHSRKKSVPGEGKPDAEIMLIGEGPGFYENEEGRPFVGPSGNFLDELLAKAGVSRKDVFITNVVKCRPPGNRDPLPEEVAACSGYLDRQIEAVNPLIIVTLGRFSMAKFLPNVKISEVHGQASWVRGRLIVPMYHPAAALHQASLRPALERDFARLPEWIAQAKQSGRQPAAARANHPEASASGMAEGAAAAAPQPRKRGTAAEQPMLGLFDVSASEEKPDPEEGGTLPKDKPTQLSLF